MLENGLDLSQPLRWGFYFVDADRRPLERVLAQLTEHGYELQDVLPDEGAVR